MRRAVEFLVLLWGFVWADVCFAYGEKLSAEVVSLLKGQEVLYSSPFLRGAEKRLIRVDEVKLSDDFFDDGKVFLNGTAYPADQLFLENSDGVFENLTSLYVYDGVGATFFLRYFDENRGTILEEKEKALQEVRQCLSDEGKLDFRVRSACLDGVYKRFLKMFYSLSYDETVRDYEVFVKSVFELFSGTAAPDWCFGKCGVLALDKAMAEALAVQADFIKRGIGAVRFDDVLRF